MDKLQIQHHIDLIESNQNELKRILIELPSHTDLEEANDQIHDLQSDIDDLEDKERYVRNELSDKVIGIEKGVNLLRSLQNELTIDQAQKIEDIILTIS
jgi:hypothetical protein